MGALLTQPPFIHHVDRLDTAACPETRPGDFDITFDDSLVTCPLCKTEPKEKPTNG